MASDDPMYATAALQEMLNLSTLTPLIRDVVALLREEGFETTDSGDGVTNVAAGMEGAIDVPHVHCQANRSYVVYVAERMRHVLNIHGVRDEQMEIQALYSPIDGIATVSLYKVDDNVLREARSKR